MFYYPEDIVVTVQSKKRATIAMDHTSASIPKPVPLRDEEGIVVLIGSQPKQLQFQSFIAYDHTFYYAYLKDLPQKFQIYSIPFVQGQASGI
jgi:hypothetical protein